MIKRILVIDDDEGILSAFQAMQTMNGYVFETHATVDRLLSTQRKKYPDLILLDVLLAGTDGRMISKQLKKQKKTKDIPIIMFSATANIEQSVKDAQADDFIQKPFEMDLLFAKIALQLKKRK